MQVNFGVLTGIMFGAEWIDIEEREQWIVIMDFFFFRFTFSNKELPE